MIKRLACITTMAFVCLPAVAQQSLGSLRVRHSPDFLKSATIYQVWLRSFTPQGTLWAARAKLPHIARLGASSRRSGDRTVGLLPDSRRRELYTIPRAFSDDFR